MSNMLYVLGASLAQAIDKEEMVCRGMLRMAISDSVEVLQCTKNDPNQVINYIKTMTYQDWKAILDGPALSQRLANIGIQEPASVVRQVKQTLIEKQSLLTMEAY